MVIFPSEAAVQRGAVVCIFITEAVSSAASGPNWVLVQLRPHVQSSYFMGYFSQVVVVDARVGDAFRFIIILYGTYTLSVKSQFLNVISQSTVYSSLGYTFATSADTLSAPRVNTLGVASTKLESNTGFVSITGPL